MLCRPTLRGIVPGLGTVCSRCSCVPAGGASGCRVPGETGRSAGQTSRSVVLQVPAWLPQGGAVSAHILEGSPAARSVRPQFGVGVWMTCMQVCTWVHKISSWVSLYPFIIYTTLSSARSRRAKANVSIDLVRGKVHCRQVASLSKGLKMHSMICSCNKRLKWLKGVASSDEQSSSQLLVHSHCSHHRSFQQQLFLANKL